MDDKKSFVENELKNALMKADSNIIDVRYNESGNTADRLQIYLATEIGILILSFGQDYSVDENMSDEQYRNHIGRFS